MYRCKVLGGEFPPHLGNGGALGIQWLMAELPYEPRRDCRRLILVCCAAADSVSRTAWASASAGGMFPMGPSRRRLLTQATRSKVEYSTPSKLRQGPRRRMPCTDGTRLWGVMEIRPAGRSAYRGSPQHPTVGFKPPRSPRARQVRNECVRRVGISPEKRKIFPDFAPLQVRFLRKTRLLATASSVLSTLGNSGCRLAGRGGARRVGFLQGAY